MKALVFDGQLRLDPEHALPRLARGESLVRVLRAGICNTDIEITKGYMRYHGILGHEFVGIVAEGDLDGERVVGEINASCGECEMCRRGNPTHCPRRTTLGIMDRPGAFAEYLTLPSQNLHRVPDLVSDREAACVEPLAAACEIPERMHIKPTDRVCVIGDGKLGLLVSQVLALTGCDLLAIGRHTDKLMILRARGIACTDNPDLVNDKFDFVVDCSGNAGGFELAHRLTRPRGTLVIKSTFHGLQELSFAAFVIDEISIAGSRCGSFLPALRLLEQDLVDVDSLVSAEFPLERGLEAFQCAVAPGMLKVQLTV